MAIFPVKFFGDPVLREKSNIVEKISEDVRVLSTNMANTMYDACGIGLAAPQIGILRQVVVIDMDKNNYVVYINPTIVEISKSTEIEDEGCLCVPNISVPVKRAKSVVVKALDLKGRALDIEADDLLARILQHEIDHLNGLTILDRTDDKARKSAIQEFLEPKQQEA
ncbi:MAG TPA: peptide deformylase [Actinobacteria bacterium]|nr:peptide deformylase [Actinomycetota bacterium]